MTSKGEAAAIAAPEDNDARPSSTAEVSFMFLHSGKETDSRRPFDDLNSRA
ncbi:hypothetical protein D3C81_1111920 [compost metagenome]